jgi:hypothetical protein
MNSKKKYESGVLGQFVFASQMLCEKDTPEAPKRARYGEYLFPQSRTEESLPDEPNTKQEQDLFDALSSFFSTNGHPEQELAKVIPQVKDALKKHYYSKVLDSGEIRVYRGMNVDLDRLREMTEPYGIKIEDGGHAKAVVCNLPGKLPPLKGRYLQSWTTEPHIARTFTESSVREQARVIFVARTNAKGNVFFGKPGNLAKIVWSEYDYEKEIVSIGKVEIDGFAFVSNNASVIGTYAELLNEFEDAAKRVH